MDARLLFPNKYIGAADLRGRNVNLTISRVVLDDLKTEKGTEKKPVIYFAEMEKRHQQGKGENKRLVMNKTNMKAIAAALGTFETEQWVGHRVTLYPTTCQAFGQVVDCVRIREQAPGNGKAQKQEPPAPDPFEDTPDYPDTDDAGAGLWGES